MNRRIISKYILTGLIIVFSVAIAFSHSEKMQLVIDTDMALDDVRSLAVILGSGKADVRMVVATEGSASIEAACKNIRKILDYFGEKNVEIVPGMETGKEAPKWRAIADGIQIPGPDEMCANDLKFDPLKAAEKIEAVHGEVIYLCLGPMTNLTAMLKADPSLKSKIDWIIFYGSTPDSDNKDFNYSFDSEAAGYVFASDIPVIVLRVEKDAPLIYDGDFALKTVKIETPAARLIADVHNTETVKSLIVAKHIQLWDDIAAIYLLNPDLFQRIDIPGKNYRLIKIGERTDILKAYLDILAAGVDATLQPRSAVVLREFPTMPELFTDDLEPYVEEIIARNGREEWIACLLTNELHRHLGGYSIIGAKMGIRAREILDAPFDELSVTSFAGSEPPLSCLNDGLQVSTGASLGRGTITIAAGKNEPSAEFTYKNRTVKLTIKEEIIETITKDIKATSEKYGWLTREYYKNLRKVAIRYWLEFDRKSIFIEQ